MFLMIKFLSPVLLHLSLGINKESNLSTKSFGFILTFLYRTDSIEENQLPVNQVGKVSPTASCKNFSCTKQMD